MARGEEVYMYRPIQLNFGDDPIGCCPVNRSDVFAYALSHKVGHCPIFVNEYLSGRPTGQS